MLTITEMFAFVTEEDRERLMSVQVRGSWLPLVACDRESVSRMTALAEADGRSYRILRFAEREDITDHLPKRSHKNGAISAISVVVTQDEDGDEEIITSPDLHLPLAAVLPQGLRAILPVAHASGQEFRVLRFRGREDVTPWFVRASDNEMSDHD